MIRMSLKKKRSTLPCIVLSDKMGRTIKSPSIDMLPASCALLVWYRWSEVVINILYHQLADGLVHFGGVSDACLVGRIMELSR
jgi:hypothetical protein